MDRGAVTFFAFGACCIQRYRIACVCKTGWKHGALSFQTSHISNNRSWVDVFYSFAALPNIFRDIKSGNLHCNRITWNDLIIWDKS